MLLAIHKKDTGFAPEWIRYCEEAGIQHKTVNVYDNDIIEQLADCDALLWHHHHGDYRDVLVAKQLLEAIQMSGKIVFPDTPTGWHFDDKVAQKYIFESLDLPAIKSYVFFDESSALKWANTTDYPKVFKLRGGAGSSNVMLVKDYSQAKSKIRKAFHGGYPVFSGISYFKDRYNKWREGRDTFKGVIKGFGRLFIKPSCSKLMHKESGYAYFQDFMPRNTFDTRVAVIGGKRAVAFRRGVRHGDFRASGSGNIMYGEIDLEMVKIAFEAARKIKSQSLALDFIYSPEGKPLIVEMSYGFMQAVPQKSGGYWTDDLEWHASDFNDICAWMIDAVVEQIKQKKNPTGE